MLVKLKNEAGIQKNPKLGFSWTMLFFGPFAPALRGDFKWAIISLVLACVTFGLAWFILPFIYNKKYVEGLLEKGYKPANKTSREILKEKGIIG